MSSITSAVLREALALLVEDTEHSVTCTAMSVPEQLMLWEELMLSL